MALDDPRGDRADYERARQKIRKAVEKGKLTAWEGDALLAFGVDKKANHPLSTVSNQLWLAARVAMMSEAVGFGPLLEIDKGAFSSLHDRMSEGEVPDRFLTYAGPNGWSEGYLRNFLNASKQYLLFVDGEPDDDRTWTRESEREWVDDVELGKPPDPKVDPSDLFGPDELAAMWTAIESKRDAALFGLLYSTWQRNAVVRSFRVGDVEIHNGGTEGAVRIYKDALGRKGASGLKGLSWAVSPVKDWLDAHPTGDQEDPLICVTHDTGDAQAGDPLSKGRSVNRRIRKWAKWAGLARERWDPSHGRKEATGRAHLLRYTGATRAAKSADFSESHVKKQGGWTQSSKQLDRYIQLTDEDVLANWAAAHGHVSSAFSSERPEFGHCGRCNAPIENWLPSCPGCGMDIDDEPPEPEITKSTVRNQMDDYLTETFAGMLKGFDKELESMGREPLGLDQEQFADELLASVKRARQGETAEPAETG